jgi:osmotically-inducible protein OsmY
MREVVMHSKRPPFSRHDQRIRDDVLDRLALNLEVDANDIEVVVNCGEVTLKGTVLTRHMKYVAHDTAEAVPGVQELHNWLHVRQPLWADARP